MTYSLNEVEATAKRAARGAGYTWGIAEDAAKATRWLCAQGLDGCGALARLLSMVEGPSQGVAAPRVEAQHWHAAGGTLCPLLTGTALSDRASALPKQGLELVELAEPALLFPFAAMVARARQRAVALTWSGGSAHIYPSQIELTGEKPLGVVTVTCRLGGALLEPATRADPAASDWDNLLSFAHRTYAPATEESRLKGAG